MSAMPFSDITKWARQELADTIVAHVKKLTSFENADTLDFDERSRLEKECDRVLKFLGMTGRADE